jgi:hypothetical protein
MIYSLVLASVLVIPVSAKIIPLVLPVVNNKYFWVGYLENTMLGW